ncbi:hypothetical protein [Rhizobium sp. 1399]|uniref:hypothetical protein n=1 Tax=Rhizobium sp. 1399 TaxID=2817758 RepID=UPI002860EB49|nr:hypothetical protein [Rhizobium sp. 1399]MDR6667072.1 hypothetical protein [Rhizobium sp. 1399]
MKSIRVLQHLKQYERGIDTTKRAIPTTTGFLRPDRPFSGRLITFNDGKFDYENSLSYEEAGDRTDVAWIRPFLSTGTRQPVPRTKGSVRGHDYDVRLNRALGFESAGEMKFGALLKADRNVVNIEDQPKSVRFWRPSALTPTEHTIDYRATFANGLRVGFPVKHTMDDEFPIVLKDVEYMRVQCSDFADDFVVVTEREVTPEIVDNAEAIAFAFAARNERDCRQVLEFMQRTEGPVDMFQIVESFDDPQCAWVALLNLIYDGLVEHLDPSQTFEDAPFVSLIAN